MGPSSRFSQDATGTDHPQISLAYLAPKPWQSRSALIGVAALLLGLAVLAPFAGKQLPQANGFVPALDAIIFVTDLITAILFFAHYSINRSRALLALACGYLLTALIVAAHGLSFPEAFSRAQDLSRAVRINFLIYLSWHLGLPTSLFAYVWLRRRDRTRAGANMPMALVAICSVAGVSALVGCLMWLAMVVDGLLPPPLSTFQPFPNPVTPWLIILTMLVCATALFVLWVFRRSVLDQWLMVVVLASMVELEITGQLGWHHFEHSHGFESRFTLGFYAGRTLFSLLTSTLVMTPLLAETTKLYASIANANMLAGAAKAFQALSSEIELPKLIERLMKIAIENGGADRGLLILRAGDEYFSRAEARATDDRVEVALRQDPMNVIACPESLIRHVIRTRERVILDDASEPNEFSADEYMRHRPSKSILCLPLMKQNELAGVLYLENASASHAFTPARIAVLELLAGQAAISLENTALYTDLQRSETFLAQGQRLSHTGSFGRNVLSDRLYWSEETYRIYELDRSVEPTLSWLIQQIHPEDRVRVQQTIEYAIHQRTGFDIEYRLLRRDNSVKYLHVVVQAIENSSGGLELVGAVTDLTERKQSEVALRQAQSDLARINRVTTMGELAASLAHELGQPISGVITNTGTCLRRLGHDEPNLDELRAGVTRIARDAQRAAEILARIRSQFQKVAPNQQSLDVNEIIPETIALLRDQAMRHEISLRTELTPDLPRVLGDRVQLQQVALNLIVNGIDAMRDVDGVREMVIQSQRTENDQILVSFTDTGIGLPPQLAEQIFDPFFTTKPHGTGMGLRICRSIVESHGGRLWAIGSLERGATFQLTLPTAAENRR